MNFARVIFRPLYWLTGKVFGLWARPEIQPESPAELITGNDAAVIYVLESGGLADLLTLERACQRHGLPSPNESFEFCGKRYSHRFVVLRPVVGLFFRRRSPGGSRRLRQLVDKATRNRKELLLVPVAIYWGRSPDKESSFFKLLFSENWDVVGRTRKFFATLLLGRDTLLRFSHPLPISAILEGGVEPSLAFRKVSRILRVHFRQRRAATVGPDLSHRRTIARQVLLSGPVRRAIDAEAGDDAEKRAKLEQKAHDYVLEIASDVSHGTIRILLRILRRLWNQIYDGIELQHADRLHDVAKDKVIVYVPCHRSHFDYLLLSYICYTQGLQLPHIAAGINLNLPVIGRILRRGGAFFLRRTFKGNRLYATVFDAYVRQLLARGYSIEYFIEGGRSRTGRLLTPKGGMLAMTVGAYVNNPKRPVVFVPVYFGYEKLIEGDSFISELGGAEKQKESLLGLIRSVKSLRETFGRVYVNIGEPLELNAILDDVRRDWREYHSENGERPEWLSEVVDRLGRDIMSGVNAAAAVTPISLLAHVMLSTPRQRIGEHELRRQLQLSQNLLGRFRYSDSVTVPDWDPDEIIRHGEKLGAISRRPHPMGELFQMDERTAVLMTYFRNNILHLLAVPAAVASCFIQGRELEHTELQRLVRLIYPFMRKELCLPWSDDEIDTVTTAAIGALVAEGLLTPLKRKRVLKRPPAGSAPAYQLLMLGQSIVPMIQRFYLAIAILLQHGSGSLSRAELERKCELSAERLSMIYGLHSPDFFNRSLFHDYIRMLLDLDVLRRGEDGLLQFDEDIVSIGADARLVLGEEVRHSILSLTVNEELASQ
ncbi:MAG TPA: glycerol-3-phosphate 1-O-acyltransferase PlsB [Woeseiaceae bacterium]|nr:glycerol-3-phosphate 1-O-acyltransferase PlsB [Woeseiaceae bacterium]